MSHEQRKWLEKFARLGYLAKGVVYLTIGVLAGLAAWRGGTPEDNRGAFQFILTQPYGKILLGTVGVGLVGYAAWRLTQAVQDTERKGKEISGILQRSGYALSGLVHFALAFVCGEAVLSSQVQGGGEQTESMTATVLNQPMGQWLVASLGVTLIAVGLFRLYTAWTKSFTDRIHMEEMSQDEQTMVVNAGRLGIAARSVIFGLTGFFFLKAAISANPQEAGALQEVLLLVEQHGAWYLAVMALGLIAYAVYQGFLARYRHINPQPV